MKAELPPNEAQRLATLRSYDVLDTAAEVGFDDLALLASQICQTPVALVSFVDENRQWFKSRIGLSATETPRDDAFCAHAILISDEVLEVRDTRLDTRFADNPLVTSDPNILFYAGAPLVTDDNCALGTLCVIDFEPRELSAEQKLALQALGRHVVAVLELRKNLTQQKQFEQSLRESEERFHDLVENANDLIQICDMDGALLYVNRAWCETLGYSKTEILDLTLQDIIHPDSLEHCMAQFQRVATEKELTGVEAVFRAKDGHKVFVEGSATCRNKDGNLFSTRSIFRDVTQRRQAEKERDRLFNYALDLYCIVGFDGCFKQVNPAWESTLGWSKEELLAKPCMEFIHPDDHEATENSVTTIKEGKNLLLFDNRYRCKDGSYRWFTWVAYPEMEEGLIFAVARDVTNDKHAETQLQEVMEQQRAILENAGYSIISTTPDGVITSFNPAAERMLGYSAAEVVGLQTPALIHDPSEVAARAQELSVKLGKTIEPGFEVFVASARQNLPNEHEWTYIRKDGTHFPVILSVTALRDAAGEISGFLGMAIDITERRHAEARFRLVVEATPNGLLMINEAGIITLVNNQVEKLFGYTREELTGLSIERLLPKRFRALHPSQRQGFFASPEVRAMGHGRDLFGQRKDGSEFQLEIGLSPLYTPEGVFVLAAVVDITARKKMQLALEQFKFTLDQTVDCVFICNSDDFRFEYVNEGAKRQVGYSEAELLEMSVLDIKTEYSVEQYRILVQPLLEGGKPSLTFETKHKHRNGYEIPVEVTMQAVFQGLQKPRLIAVVRDSSERKRAEELLRSKNEELKGFAYTVSHDLKAPLRGISGYAQELERRHKAGLTERAQFCVKQIITASHNLDGLIEDLLTYSRVDSEVPTVTEVDLSVLVKGIMKDRSLVVAEQGVEVNVCIPAITLNIWERGLHQVLTNLIDNAIKYSRNAKPPCLSISAEQTSSTCLIVVKDNGVGFDMKYHDRIFGLFNRLVRADEFEGSGAGLAIVSKLLNKLGGSIRAESEVGQGATFFVELPMTSLRNPLS